MYIAILSAQGTLHASTQAFTYSRFNSVISIALFLPSQHEVHRREAPSGVVALYSTHHRIETDSLTINHRLLPILVWPLSITFPLVLPLLSRFEDHGAALRHFIPDFHARLFGVAAWLDLFDHDCS